MYLNVVLVTFSFPSVTKTYNIHFPFTAFVSQLEGVCDFEIDFCGWTHDLTGDYNWTRDAGGTPSSGTGPKRDHSTGTDKGN